MPTRRELDEWLAPKCYPNSTRIWIERRADGRWVAAVEDSASGTTRDEALPTHSLDVVWRAKDPGWVVTLWYDREAMRSECRIRDRSQMYAVDGSSIETEKDEPAYALGLAIWEAGREDRD